MRGKKNPLTANHTRQVNPLPVDYVVDAPDFHKRLEKESWQDFWPAAARYLPTANFTVRELNGTPGYTKGIISTILKKQADKPKAWHRSTTNDVEFFKFLLDKTGEMDDKARLLQHLSLSMVCKMPNTFIPWFERYLKNYYLGGLYGLGTTVFSLIENQWHVKEELDIESIKPLIGYWKMELDQRRGRGVDYEHLNPTLTALDRLTMTYPGLTEALDQELRDLWASFKRINEPQWVLDGHKQAYYKDMVKQFDRMFG